VVCVALADCRLIYLRAVAERALRTLPARPRSAVRLYLMPRVELGPAASRWVVARPCFGGGMPHRAVARAHRRTVPPLRWSTLARALGKRLEPTFSVLWMSSPHGLYLGRPSSPIPSEFRRLRARVPGLRVFTLSTAARRSPVRSSTASLGAPRPPPLPSEYPCPPSLPVNHLSVLEAVE